LILDLIYIYNLYIMKKVVILIFVLFFLTSCFNWKITEKEVIKSNTWVNVDINNINSNNDEEIDNDINLDNDALVNSEPILDEESEEYYATLNSEKYQKTYEKVDNLDISKNIDFWEISFSNLKGASKEKWEINDDWEIQIKEFKVDLYNNDFLINAFIENDASVCDKNELVDDFWDISFSKYCRWKFYLHKMLIENDFSYCNNFKDNSDYWYLVWSEVWNSAVCKKLFDLNNVESVTDWDILKFLFDIKLFDFEWSYDKDLFNTIKTIISNENHCSKISVMKNKMTCYVWLYHKDFYNNFEDKIYPDLLKSEYLHEENDSMK
jgi:hypothetical protein